MTAEELAVRVNTSKYLLLEIESGNHIPDEKLITEIAGVFSVPVEEILTATIDEDDDVKEIKNEYLLDERYINYRYKNTYLSMNVRDFFQPYKLLDAYNKLNNGNDIKHKYVFKNKKKKHSKEDFKEIFTLRTNEEEDLEIKAPWVFIRFFIIVLIVISAAFMLRFNEIGVILSVVLFPVSILLYIYEVNYPRNISLFKLLSMVIIGGIFSVLFVFIVRFFTGYGWGLFGQLLTGIIEEGAKGIVAFYYICKLKPKYILSGILIGAAVGTGFSIIETYLYVFSGNPDTIRKLMVALIRGLLSIGGGHIIWAAITAGALTMIVGNNKAHTKDLLSSNYLKVLLLFVVIHAIWNLFGSLPVSVVICIIGLILIRKQINVGIIQYDISLKLNNTLKKNFESNHTGDSLFFTLD
jgi:RsiW-degrading membrane proteinase PrsW (M82 family)/DNA-binding XRE family transcriptional regulator